MKEELKSFMRLHETEYWYGCSSEQMEQLIDEFFDQYQPDSSKREDLYIDLGSGHLESKLKKFADGELNPNEYKMRCSEH